MSLQQSIENYFADGKNRLFLLYKDLGNFKKGEYFKVKNENITNKVACLRGNDNLTYYRVCDILTLTDYFKEVNFFDIEIEVINSKNIGINDLREIYRIFNSGDEEKYILWIMEYYSNNLYK